MRNYKIRFLMQVRQGFEDYEYNSIYLTTEDYFKLPELSMESFPSDCEISKGEFFEPVRPPSTPYPAVFVKNDAWIRKNSDYLEKEVYWVFVCIDVERDFWIAFKYWDSADLDEAYGATVNVSFPGHGEVYRLDESCMNVVREFY